MAHLTRVIKSEWTKITTVRSTVWTLGIAFLLTVLAAVGFGLLMRNMGTDQRPTLDATATSFSGMGFGLLAMVAFGVLVVSGEYSSGMIRASLAAVPRRGVLMAAKTLACTLPVLAVGLITSFASFFLGQLALGGELNTTLGEPGVLRAVLGAGLYLALMALFAVGVTWVLRTPLLSFGILMPFFFIISGILMAVEQTRPVAQFFPDQAGSAIMNASGAGDFDRDYSPAGGLLILVAWVAAALLAGYLTMKRRDA